MFAMNITHEIFIQCVHSPQPFLQLYFQLCFCFRNGETGTKLVSVIQMRKCARDEGRFLVYLTITEGQEWHCEGVRRCSSEGWDPENKHLDDQNKTCSVLKKCTVIHHHLICQLCQINPARYHLKYTSMWSYWQ